MLQPHKVAACKALHQVIFLKRHNQTEHGDISEDGHHNDRREQERIHGAVFPYATPQRLFLPVRHWNRREPVLGHVKSLLFCFSILCVLMVKYIARKSNRIFQRFPYTFERWILLFSNFLQECKIVAFYR